MYSIKYKILISFCLTALLSIALVGMVVSLRINASISQQSEKLTADMTRQIYETLNLPHQTFELLIHEDIQRSAHNLRKSPTLIRNFEAVQPKALDAELYAIANEDALDFIMLWDLKGHLQASFPIELDDLRVEAYFSTWGFGAYLQRLASADSIDTKTIWTALSRHDSQALKDFGLRDRDIAGQGALSIAAAGMLSNDFQEPIGIFLVGKLLNGYTQPLQHLNDIAGYASVIYLDATPIAQAGFAPDQGDVDPATLQLSPEMQTEIFHASGRTNQKMMLAGKRYLTASSALKSFTGEPIGILTIGLPESQITAMQQTVISDGVRTRETIQWWIARIGVLSLCLFILVSLAIAIRIVTPIKQLSAIAQRIAAGDVQQEVPVASHDEVGDLSRSLREVVRSFRAITTAYEAISTGNLTHEITPRSEQDALGQAFQRMSAYLKEMTAAATAIARGDLRQEVQPKTEHDVLGIAFHNMKAIRQTMSQVISGTSLLDQASEGLEHISSQMAADAEHTAQQIAEVSSATQQISQNVTEVSTAAEQFDANIREISRNVHEVSQVAAAAVNIANSANTTISALGSSSQEIGDIVKFITSIAQQTNLLALNARIEAARAGEMGKGFAIVASEVKDLARATATSAEDIIRKVEAIQTSSQDVTAAVLQLSGIIRQIHTLADAIATAVEEQATAMTEISRNIAETAHSGDEISHTITGVSETAQRTSERAATVQTAALELTTLAERLRRLVEQFQI